MPDNLRNAIWFLASWGLAVVFFIVSYRIVKRPEPAQFWPWTKIKAEQLKNVSLYNQENCTMWMLCCILFAVNGIIGLFHQGLSAVIFALYIFPGSLLLVRRYNRILRRYFLTPNHHEEEKSK